MPVDEIVRHILEILSLFEWKTKGSPTPVEDFKSAVSSFLLATCESSVDVLKAVQKRRNELLDKDTVIKCLCNLELTGDSLLRAVLTVGSCPELVSALGLFHSRGVKPTFKQLWDSTTDSDAARRLLIRTARCGQASTVEEWKALLDEVLELTLSVYADVIKPEESMDIVIREMLSDPNIPHERSVLQLFLTLDKNSSKENNHNRLSLEKSAELLIGKSEELMQEASAPSDPILRESRSLAEAAREIAPKMAAQQIKLLDIVDLSCELGSTALPVAIKFAEPYPFLEEIVKLDGNYKQMAALLTNVSAPIALCTALTEEDCCDRERFIEDPEYRKETIIGLAMTEDDVMYADALQLAQDFKMNDWPVHFSSLENALTSLSVQEAKTILKSRGHLARLRSDLDRLHSQLRTLVGPLMTSNEQFVAYCTLFADGQPERAALPVIKRILEKKRDTKAVRLFKDKDYLKNIIISMPDRVILSLVEGLLSIPVGSEACESAARVLLDGTDIRPAANPAVIFALLGNDEANFVDLVANKSVSDEIEYLERAVLILEATPNVNVRLLEVVRVKQVIDNLNRQTISFCPVASRTSREALNAANTY
ncbi:unnamed protein product [Nippostrongylus brasiliensis]|uniref:Uncharacterized protein n=1 Tax=Nippostrongylus brasiliensis TaxID=27835 RepID=A0A3P7BN59_NIPBR|nr:unnamed protein product [Nippostrongylus brasiliensis]